MSKWQELNYRLPWSNLKIPTAWSDSNFLTPGRTLISQHHCRTQLLTIMVGPQLQLSASMAQNSTSLSIWFKVNSQLTLFQNLQIFMTIASGHDVIHTPASFPIWSLLLYLPNPSTRAGYDTRSIFKRSLTGFNSEFSFSLISYLTKAEEPSLSYYLPIAGGRIIGFIPFPGVYYDNCDCHILCARP